jgi:hypothetical protein
MVLTAVIAFQTAPVAKSENVTGPAEHNLGNGIVYERFDPRTHALLHLATLGIHGFIHVILAVLASQKLKKETPLTAYSYVILATFLSIEVCVFRFQRFRVPQKSPIQRGSAAEANFGRTFPFLGGK